MKILLVSPLPPPTGGIATWTQKYLQYCKNYKLDADLVNTAAYGRRAEKINYKRNFADEVIRTKNIFQSLIYHLKKNSYDLVHINTSCEKFGIIRDWICMKIIRTHRQTVVLHCRCNVQYEVSRKKNQYIFRSMLKSADKVIVLNQSSFDFVERIQKNKAVIVPNFIEEDFNINTLKVRKEIKRIIFVGHVQFAKGYREIVESARIRTDIEFILAGPICDEIKMIDKPKNVTLLGNIAADKVKSELGKSDLFLFPSYTEGFANALLEAMAYGLPVIASNVGANLEMIENRGGIIICPQDSDSIVRAISRLESKDIRKDMSKWNIKKVNSEYTIPKVMEKLKCIYDSVKC